MNAKDFQPIVKSSNFNNIQDFIAAYYGEGYGIKKADAPLLSDTTGTFNDVYGAEVWNQLNENINIFSILPKKPYQKAGFRLKTARGQALPADGTAENGTLPDTVKPTYAQGAMVLKHCVTAYEGSLLKDLRARVGNDDIDLDQVRRDLQEEHMKFICRQLMTDAGTLASYRFESVDRVCSSQNEESVFYDAGDCDIYGFDRSGSTNYDAYVNHNSGTDRVLTKSLLRAAINTIYQNSGEYPNVVVTGYDTYQNIEVLFEGQARLTIERGLNGINGVSTAAGNDVGVAVASCWGIPVIREDQTIQDTASRIYFLNTKYLWFEVAMPTSNFETQYNADMIIRNKLGVKGMFLTAGELKCVKFSAMGKIRDLL